MLGRTGPAKALPACRCSLRWRAALGAEAVAGVPVQNALGLRHHAEQWRGQQALHGEAAQVEADVAAVALTRFGSRLVEARGEDRARLVLPEQRGLACRAKARQFAAAEKRVERRAALAQQGNIAREDQMARAGCRPQAGDESSVIAAVGEAVERVGSIAGAGGSVGIGLLHGAPS